MINIVVIYITLAIGLLHDIIQQYLIVLTARKVENSSVVEPFIALLTFTLRYTLPPTSDFLGFYVMLEWKRTAVQHPIIHHQCKQQR
jgi:hypothetical protein